MKSKITGGETTLAFTAKLLGKYDVSYYRCNETGFIQTEEPYWLDEAYGSAITKLDIGLVQRNLNLAELVDPVLKKHFNHNAAFLDYAGGYGLFTRLMRYRGFDFYHTDKFCQNLFAEYNDLSEYKGSSSFELVTAFEVLEHLTDPLPEIQKMLEYSDNLLFSTELLPAGTTDAYTWWYFSLETGQHVSFYTTASLEYIAKKLGKHFYSNGENVHLFTSNPLKSNPFPPKSREPFLVRKARKFVKRYDMRSTFTKPNLLEKDTQEAKARINKQ